MANGVKNGQFGRIPNWAKERVEKEVEKYGFYLAFHYFMYDCDTTNLQKWEIQYWRAFDRYAKLHNIPEEPLDEIEMI